MSGGELRAIRAEASGDRLMAWGPVLSRRSWIVLAGAAAAGALSRQPAVVRLNPDGAPGYGLDTFQPNPTGGYVGAGAAHRVGRNGGQGKG